MITAGPTMEAIDPVRYLSNHSSGKMGFALAGACAEAGAQVELISGPVHWTHRSGHSASGYLGHRDVRAGTDALGGC